MLPMHLHIAEQNSYLTKSFTFTFTSDDGIYGENVLCNMIYVLSQNMT